MGSRYSEGLSDSILDQIRKHTNGTETLSSRALKCHYCGHKTIIVFEDSYGHVQAKCRKCGREAIYNTLLRRTHSVMYRRVI
jgi:ribosomal protein S27E